MFKFEKGRENYKFKTVITPLFLKFDYNVYSYL